MFGLFLIRIVNKNLAYKECNIICIFDNSRYFDSSGPVIIIETLEESQLVELFLCHICIITNLNISGRSGCTLSHILGNHEEFKSLTILNHFSIYNSTTLTISKIINSLTLSSSSSTTLLYHLLLITI